MFKAYADTLILGRRAGLDALEGKQTEKVRVLGQADVVRLGRTEWKDGE